MHDIIKISDHIFLVSRQDPQKPDIAHCDVFAIDCGTEAILIDSGPGGTTYAPLKSNLQSLGLWNKLRKCLITHIHEDHASGVPQLCTDNIDIFASRPAVEYTRNLPLIKKHYRDEPPVINNILEDGDVLTAGNIKFQTIYTPGHTAGCATWIAEIDGLRCAFTGDLLFPNGSIGWSGGFDFNAENLMKSLERLLSLKIDAIFTGHQWNPKSPADFWLKNAKTHIQETIAAGQEGLWKIEK